MIWVVDASVALRWFMKNENHPNADAILERVISQPEDFAVPELFCFEVYAALCRLHPSGHEVFVNGMIPILHSGIFRYPMTETLAAHAVRYVKKGLTGYDACYVALAKEVKGIWLTFDEKAHTLIVKERLSHSLVKSLPKSWK
jgi:predicted nucleic acid-binding protein